MKKIFALVMTILLAAAFAACDFDGNDPAPPTSTVPSSSEVESRPFKVGISLPTRSLQRWNQDGINMQEKFEEAGYEVDLQFAGDNEIPLQVSQIETMISGGCDVLVIAAINGSTLTTVLESAKGKNIKVIAYDRLIMDSDAVTYYASFDNFKVGVTQGAFIEEALGLKSEKGPFNMELFTGNPDDPGNISVDPFFGGAMDVLQPYLDNGKLKVPSGERDRNQCSIENGSTENAQKRMENLIKSQGYGPKGKRLDAVYCANDRIANGVTNALLEAGYEGGDGFPVITGMDCDFPNIKNMLADAQAMSVLKDTDTLMAQVVKMVDAIAVGEEPEVNDTQTYDNGTGIIPAFLCDSPFYTAEHDKEFLEDLWVVCKPYDYEELA